MKSLAEYIKENLSQEIDESLLLTAAAAALIAGTVAGTAAVTPRLFDKVTRRREDRKTYKLSKKMERIEMLRQANKSDWNDFFDVASKFGPDTLHSILKTDPQLNATLTDIEKDREIQRLRAELAEVRSRGDSDEGGKISDLLKRIANRLTDKQIEILNRAADKLQDLRF
jgi:hypothetical protein